MIEQPLWRVGKHQERNIYRGDTQVAVAVGEETEAGGIAHRIVASLNHTEGLAECERACPECHRCMCQCDDEDEDDAERP